MILNYLVIFISIFIFLSYSFNFSKDNEEIIINKGQTIVIFYILLIFEKNPSKKNFIKKKKTSKINEKGLFFQQKFLDIWKLFYDPL